MCNNKTPYPYIVVYTAWNTGQYNPTEKKLNLFEIKERYLGIYMWNQNQTAHEESKQQPFVVG